MGCMTTFATVSLLVLLTTPSSPPPVLRGCTPPPDLCEQMLKDCAETGMTSERCDVVAGGICPGSACMAKTAAFWTCFEEGLDCTEMLDNMGKAMVGCSCDLRCEDTHDLSLERLFAMCLTYPSAIGDDCAEPSADRCVDLLTLPPETCSMDACEYVACQRDIMAQNDLLQICAEPPPSCAKLVACDEAENGGGKPAPATPLGWSAAPPSGERCLRLSEVFVRPDGPVAHRQWVEISNVCGDEVDLSVTGTVLRWTQPGKNWSGAMSLAGVGVVGPGGCLVVGGPQSVPANFSPDFDLPISFSPALMLDGAAGVAGVGLFDALATVTPFDAVAYGSGSATLNGADGKPAHPVAAAMPVAHSLERHGQTWVDTPAPSPGACAALTVPAFDWSDRPRNCCEAHGSVPGKDNICRASSEPFCVGCDGEPVLCMTTGCGAHSSEACCLDSEGRTGAC